MLLPLCLNTFKFVQGFNTCTKLFPQQLRAYSPAFCYMSYENMNFHLIIWINKNLLKNLHYSEVMYILLHGINLVICKEDISLFCSLIIKLHYEKTNILYQINTQEVNVGLIYSGRNIGLEL